MYLSTKKGKVVLLH